MNARIECDRCGTEPVPIGSFAWRRWWLAHWTVCEGVTLDQVTLDNLRTEESCS